MNDESFRCSSKLHIDNYFNQYFIQKSKAERKMMSEYVKSQLSESEYETLMTVVQFFEIVSPIKEEENLIFIDAIDRFSVHLLGYKYTDAYESKSQKALAKIKLEVTSLSDIIRILIIGVKYDFEFEKIFIHNEEDFEREHSLNYGLRKSLTLSSKRKLNNYTTVYQNSVVQFSDFPQIKNAKRVTFSEYNININNSTSKKTSDNQNIIMKRNNKPINNFFDNKISCENFISSDISEIHKGRRASPLKMTILNSNTESDDSYMVECLNTILDKKSQISTKSIENFHFDMNQKKERVSMIYSPKNIISEIPEDSHNNDSFKILIKEIKKEDDSNVTEGNIKHSIKSTPLNKKSFKDEDSENCKIINNYRGNKKSKSSRNLPSRLFSFKSISSEENTPNEKISKNFLNDKASKFKISLHPNEVSSNFESSDSPHSDKNS